MPSPGRVVWIGSSKWSYQIEQVSTTTTTTTLTTTTTAAAAAVHADSSEAINMANQTIRIITPTILHYHYYYFPLQIAIHTTLVYPPPPSFPPPLPLSSYIPKIQTQKTKTKKIKKNIIIPGREAILRVHVRRVPKGPDVDLSRISQITPSLSGKG